MYIRGTKDDNRPNKGKNNLKLLKDAFVQINLFVTIKLETFCF